MAEERNEKNINPGGPEEPSREDETRTDQGTSIPYGVARL